MENKVNSVGEKIRNFRQQAGVSQFNLEMEIGAAPGSLSRIEQGIVNPSKETLIKIINALDLKSYEALTLFDLDFEELPKMVELTKKLSSNLDLDELLQNIVNEVAYDLGLFGVMALLCDEEYVYAKGLTQTWYTKLVFDLLPAPMNTLKTSRKTNTENLIVKTVNEKKPFLTKHIRDLSKNVIPDWISDFVQRVNGTKCLIGFPMIVENEVVGAVSFSKDKGEDFNLEYNILKTLADYIAVAVMNAKKYSELKEELQALKENKTDE